MTTTSRTDMNENATTRPNASEREPSSPAPPSLEELEEESEEEEDDAEEDDADGFEPLNCIALSEGAGRCTEGGQCIKYTPGDDTFHICKYLVLDERWNNT